MCRCPRVEVPEEFGRARRTLWSWNHRLNCLMWVRGELNLVPLQEDAFLIAEPSLWPEALTFEKTYFIFCLSSWSFAW